MLALFSKIERVVPIDVPVLIRDDTGMGKELVARAIWQLSSRRDRFEAVNAGELYWELLLSERFGHGRGAFTGAIARKPGLLAVAEGGTVFVHEVGEPPLDAQVMRLCFLQSGEIQPAGVTETRGMNVWVIAATHSRPRGGGRVRNVPGESLLPPAPRRAERAPRPCSGGRHARGAEGTGAVSVARQRGGVEAVLGQAMIDRSFSSSL